MAERALQPSRGKWVDSGQASVSQVTPRGSCGVSTGSAGTGGLMPPPRASRPPGSTFPGTGNSKCGPECGSVVSHSHQKRGPRAHAWRRRPHGRQGSREGSRPVVPELDLCLRAGTPSHQGGRFSLCVCRPRPRGDQQGWSAFTSGYFISFALDLKTTSNLGGAGKHPRYLS